MFLSEFEQKAKNYLLNLLFEGSIEPCDDHLDADSFNLPQWYNEKLFKRGQKYCEENRSGVLLATFYGGISVICDPKTASILARGKSRHPQLAKNRGILTALSMTSWFREPLKEGSRSYETLKSVRKMHLHASRTAANNNGIGCITQFDMSMQHFAVMGYVLTKPHHLGIAFASREDRAAFVHFYAVIVHMLGIKDEFNMCLYELDVVEIICRCLMRYAFAPSLQLQTIEFTRIAKSFTISINQLIPFSTYESQLFMIKRLNSVFGYQYNLNINEEIIQRQNFNSNELNMIKEQFQHKVGCEYRRNLFFDENLYQLKIVKKCEGNFNRNENWNAEEVSYLKNFYSLNDNCELKICHIQEDSMKNHFNDEKINEMSLKDRIFLYLFTNFLKHLQNPIIKMISNKFVDIVLASMENELLKSKKRNLG